MTFDGWPYQGDQHVSFDYIGMFDLGIADAQSDWVGVGLGAGAGPPGGVGVELFSG